MTTEMEVNESADGFKYASSWAEKMCQLLNGVVDHDDIELMLTECFANAGRTEGGRTLMWTTLLEKVQAEMLSAGGVFSGENIALLTSLGEFADQAMGN